MTTTIIWEVMEVYFADLPCSVGLELHELRFQSETFEWGKRIPTASPRLREWHLRNSCGPPQKRPDSISLHRGAATRTAPPVWSCSFSSTNFPQPIPRVVLAEQREWNSTVRFKDTFRLTGGGRVWGWDFALWAGRWRLNTPADKSTWLDRKVGRVSSKGPEERPTLWAWANDKLHLASVSLCALNEF